MSSQLLVLTWTAAGATIGTLSGSWTRRLLHTPPARPATLRLIVVILTAVLFGLLAWRLVDIVDLAAYSIVGAVGVPLAIIDTLEQRLPSALLYPAIATIVVLLATSAQLTATGPQFLRALAGMAIMAAFYLLLALVSAGGLGAGDIKLGALLALILAWASWSSLLMGTLFGWVLSALIWIVRCIIRPSRHAQQDIGAYLLAGTFVTIAVMPPPLT